ncbi:MAG: protein kinase, partial [Deltaproteobacteria bacterium]|nr:protein kinase [Deltaproteobacteria bacterium]MBW2533687.1 protein kinase [Deltaproteobacteria bacterium]
TPVQGSDWDDSPTIDVSDSAALISEAPAANAGIEADLVDADGAAEADFFDDGFGLDAQSQAAPTGDTPSFELEADATMIDETPRVEVAAAAPPTQEPELELDLPPAGPDSGTGLEFVLDDDPSQVEAEQEIRRIEPAEAEHAVEELTLELDLPPARPAPRSSSGGLGTDAAASEEWDLDIPDPLPHPSAPPPPTAAARVSWPPQPEASRPRAKWPEKFGPYLLERRIGAGTWSESWLARPRSGTSPAPRLVVKRPRPGSGATAEQLDQIALRHQVANHPGLIEVYESGIIESVPYLATEFVDGVDLRRLLNAVPIIGRSIPYAVSTLVARRCAVALGALHAAQDADGNAGWLHGDLRPSKILVSLAGQVKLGTVGHGLQRAGQRRPADLPAKYDYQAPEELAGDPLDTTTDLFALATVLGELLVGEPIFPGRGLDVLFAVQQADCEHLRNVAAMLPGGMFDVCERALARFRSDRFVAADELAAALEPYEASATRPPDDLLVEWVARARKALPDDPDDLEEGAFPERTAMTSLASEGAAARRSLAEQQREPPIKVRRAESGTIAEMSLHQLIEAIATGGVGPDDEVRWGKDVFEAIRDVEPLARHLLLSAPSMQGTVVDSTAPDHVYHVRQTSMLEVLAQMRQCYATGMLLAQTQNEEVSRRREVFLQDGRLLSVRSSEPGDLLGEYLRNRGVIDGAQQAKALASLPAFRGNMGNALVGLGFAEAADIYRALRQQARDRLATVFAWPDARIDVYLSCNPPHVAFPLDLDLACAMMDGVLIASGDDPSGWLPKHGARVEPGPRLPPTEGSEVDGVPLELRLLGDATEARPTVDEAVTTLAELASSTPNAAAAAIVVARSLQWVTVRETG